MSIDQKHPSYSEMLPDWILMRDSYKGQRQIKNKGRVYLPATEGQEIDGLQNSQQRGWKSYDAYRLRAVYPPFVRRAVETALGVMHHKPPTIELPAVMEPMRNDATVRGESLNQLLRRINEEQLITGRVGLLADIDPTGIDPRPYIATYNAEHIINWDDGSRDELVNQTLNLVVLDETEFERQPSDFSWEKQEKYRVLILGNADDNESQGVYQVGVFRVDNGSTLNLDLSQMTVPTFRGQEFQEIPFVFVNSKDLVVEPDEPPLLAIANLALTVYRGEADYRHSLFMQGQDTFVVIGTVIGMPDDDTTEPRRIGAGASINLDQGGDAKYVGVTSSGLSEQREAILNDRAEATRATGNLLDTESRDRESGNALTIRRGAQTANVATIVLSGAAGLEAILKKIAVVMGANPDEVSVKPNMDFATQTLSGQELIEYQTSKSLGAPISRRTIHTLMRNRGTTEMTYDEEITEIENEGPLIDESSLAAEEARRGIADDSTPQPDQSNK